MSKSTILTCAPTGGIHTPSVPVPMLAAGRPQMRRIRGAIENLGLSVATPAEARQRLALKGGDQVGF
ncbi:hypothetical protein [Parasedimentitalea marina]|uniref:hypothetical protein n=1 Tax=Parasedimentitalea marina TaxID=2483033 RepID=UPI0026BFA4D5